MVVGAKSIMYYGRQAPLVAESADLFDTARHPVETQAVCVAAPLTESGHFMPTSIFSTASAQGLYSPYEWYT